MAFTNTKWTWYGWIKRWDIGDGAQVKRVFDPFHRRGCGGFRIGWGG